MKTLSDLLLKKCVKTRRDSTEIISIILSSSNLNKRWWIIHEMKRLKANTHACFTSLIIENIWSPSHDMTSCWWRFFEVWNLSQVKTLFSSAMLCLSASAATLETFCIFSWASLLYSAKFRPISHLRSRDTIGCDTTSCGAGLESILAMMCNFLKLNCFFLNEYTEEMGQISYRSQLDA